MSASRAVAWLVWIIVSIFYSFQYVLRVMPNIMMDDLTQQFHIDSAAFGQFSGVYYLGYSLMHLPIGIMLDRVGPKKVMTGCILLTVIGLLPILYSDHWIYPLLGRALIGVGSSAAILGTFKVIRMSFQERYFSRMLSVSVMIGLIGAIYGGGPVSSLCQWLGYQSLVEIFMIIGAVLACLTFLVVPDIKKDQQESVLINVRTVFKNSKVMMLCCFAGLMLGPLEGFSDVWGSGYLKQAYLIDATASNYLPSLIYVGMCFGSPALSFIAEKTGYYLGTVIMSGIVMFTIFICLVAGVFSLAWITMSFIVVGVCCAYQILVIYKVSCYVPENLAGIATAVANMIIMIFGYGFHTVIGFVIHINGGTHVSHALTYGIGVIPLALAVGVVGFLFFSYRENQSILS